MAAGFPTPACTFFPLARGNMVDMAAAAFGVARLPTDPIGSAALTIESEVNLTGAEIRIYDLDNMPAGSLGTELAGVESCSTPTFSYPYSYGLEPNLVWIQIMAPGFEEYGQRYTLPTRDTTLSLILQPELNT